MLFPTMFEYLCLVLVLSFFFFIKLCIKHYSLSVNVCDYFTIVFVSDRTTIIFDLLLLFHCIFVPAPVSKHVKIPSRFCRRGHPFMTSTKRGGSGSGGWG